MRIIGFDLGTSNVKALELDSVLGRYEIHDYHEKPVQPGESPIQVATSIFNELQKKPDKVVIELPSHQITFRNLDLPTKVKKEIQNTIGFELEDDLPFKFEDTAFDSSILSQSKTGTQVHIAATLKKHLAEFLFKLEESGIDPDVVTTEAWAYRTFFNAAIGGEDQEKPCMLVNLGKQQSSIYIQWKGCPVILKHIPWGGDDLTSSIADSYQIPFDEAEAAKIDSGFVLSESQKSQATQEQQTYSDALLGTMKRLFIEIRQTALSCRSHSQQNPNVIYLTGGPSLLPGFSNVIQEESGISTQAIKSLSRVSKSGISYSKTTDASFLKAVGFAMSVTGPERSKVINFRKGDFQKANASGQLDLSQLRKIAAPAAAIVASLLISVFAQNNVYKSKIEDIDSRLRKSIRTFFGGTLSPSAIRTYLSNPSRLKAAVEKELSNQKELSNLFSKNPKSPISFLKKLSQTVPKSITVDMVEFEVGSPSQKPYDADTKTEARFSLLVSAPKDGEQIERELKNLFSSLKRESQKEVPSPYGDGKKIQVSFRGTPKESAYGR